MMDFQKNMSYSFNKIAKLLLLGLSLNILGSASVAAATTTGGSFSSEVLEQKTEKEAVNQFYAAFLKNQVENERLEEKAKQDARHQAGYNPKHPELPKIFEIESMKLLMRYFDNSNSADSVITSGAYFSSNVYNDLNVFPDPTNAKRVTVFSDFSNLTNTMAGKLGLLEMLSHPLSDIDKLRERQKILEHLFKNDALFKELDASLKKFGKAEKSLLYFMKTKDDGSNRDDFRRYFDENIKTGGGSFGSDVMWYGELSGRMVPSLLLGTYVAWCMLQNASLPIKFFPGMDKSSDKKINDTLKLDIHPFGNVHFTLYINLALIALCGFGAYKSWKGLVTPRSEMGKRFQSCMIDVTDIVDATKEISEAIGRNDTLASTIPGYKEILAEVSGQDKGELKSILDTFDSSSFNGTATATGPKGKIFQAFKVMCEKADKFTEISRFVSRLDALMSVVKALRMSNTNSKYIDVKGIERTKAKYSIPKFLKSEDGKPYLRANKFWHPTLDPRKAVTNDIELGKTYRNVILTGANAGGKSTWMQSLALVAVLAQTFGIVPAESAALTPFSLIIADTKAETTIGTESLYQNELRKLMDAIRQIKSLGSDKFALYIVDEPLKGSDAKQCAEGALAAIRSFGLHINAMVVVATHFQELTKLADRSIVDDAIKGVFENFKVDSRLYESEKYQDAYLHHTYKVVPGVSTEKVAKHLLDLAYRESEMGALVSAN